MIVGIDASNIRAGGGITHLVQTLAAAEPARAGVHLVRVWAGRDTLACLPERTWLEPVHVPVLDRHAAARAFWQYAVLPRVARRACDVLFAPGGRIGFATVPTVVVSQNMLPFEPNESARYGRLGTAALRFRALRVSQGDSFQRADGVIFLTRYARDAITSQLRRPPRLSAIIPHGIEERFRREPPAQAPLSSFTRERPFRWLYVSVLGPYKHHDAIAAAVARLRRRGLPVELDLIGPPGDEPSNRRLREALAREDPDGTFIRWRGAMPHRKLHEAYFAADGFVFASSCENMPNILIEAMASGLPIACSNRGPMPEVLQEAGGYFDPERIDSVTSALYGLLSDETKRARIALRAHALAAEFTWKRTASETFAFLAASAQSRRR